MEHLQDPKGEIIDVTALMHEDNVREAALGEHHEDQKPGKATRHTEYFNQFSPVVEESTKLSSFKDRDDSDFSSRVKNESTLLDFMSESINQASHKKLDSEDSIFSRSGPLLIGQGRPDTDDNKSPLAHGVPGDAVISGKGGIEAGTKTEGLEERMASGSMIVKPAAQIRLPTALVKDTDKNLFEGTSRGGLTKKQIIDVLYWTDIRKSAMFFIIGCLILLCFTLFPFLSVLAYIGLFAMSAGIALRLIALVTSYFKKDQAGTAPMAFDETYVESYLNKLNVEISESNVQSKVPQFIAKWNGFIHEAREILQAKDIVLTLKVALGLWLLTYISGTISFAGLLLIAYVGGFTLPKFYQVYEKPLNRYYTLLAAKLREIFKAVENKYENIRAKKSVEKRD